MTATTFFNRLCFRRTPQEMAAIVADITPAEPPTQREVIDQIDADVVRQFQCMLDVDAD